MSSPLNADMQAFLIERGESRNLEKLNASFQMMQTLDDPLNPIITFGGEGQSQRENAHLALVAFQLLANELSDHECRSLDCIVRTTENLARITRMALAAHKVMELSSVTPSDTESHETESGDSHGTHP